MATLNTPPHAQLSNGMSNTAASTVLVAKTTSQVEAWRQWWATMPLTNVDADIDYFLSVVAHDPAVVAPYVLRVEAAGQAPVLVVGRLVDERFRARLPGVRIVSLRARALVISFDGVVGATTREQRLAVTAAITDALTSGDADVVTFQKLDHASAWFAHLTSGATEDLRRRGGRPRHVVRPVETSWICDLPDSWEAWLGSRSAKSRRQMRYDDNRLRRTYGDRLELRRLHEPEESGRLMTDVRSVAEESYQRGLGVSVVDGPVPHALLSLARDKGWLRVWMLYIDDEPVAFWWGQVQAGVLAIGAPGFRPEFSKDRVGYYTLRRMLEDSANDPDIKTIDFGSGDADYKARFGTHRRTVSDVLLFARRPRSLGVLALLRVQDRAIALAKSMLDKGGRAEQVRRWWRARNSAAAVTPADERDQSERGAGRPQR